MDLNVTKRKRNCANIAILYKKIKINIDNINYCGILEVT